VLFVELIAPLEVRIKRAGSLDRRRIKVHAPDPERVAYLEENMSLKSPSPFFYPDIYTKIDTTDKTPEQITQEIATLL
jgi:hypothetical protein